MCQGNGEITVVHPFCVIFQEDSLYFKDNRNVVFY